MDRVQPELKDIMEAINRYAVVNKNEVCFIGTFVAFDKEGEVKDDSDRFFAYGDRETLLTQLHELLGRLLEEEDEFVNW